ncbi:unnamed protein product, partial [Meganyctiphanes norvegica]
MMKMMLCLLLATSLLGLLTDAALPCGKPKPQARIVGGTDSKVNKLPWQVALTEPNMGIPFCSGVLVAPQFVLTAASCVNAKASYDLVLNEHNWQYVNRIIRRKPAEVTVHPDYANGNDYNVALVKLSDGPVMSVPTVCMPTKKLKIHMKSNTFAAGWGATEKGGQASPALQELKVKLMKECVDDSVDKDVTMCSLDSGLCSGDEGSPVMMYKKKKHTLVAIASAGGCGDEGALDYYTSVKAEEIREWVDTVIA